jgi:arginase family enzyme
MTQELTEIEHLVPRPGWAVQSLIDPAYAKLGGLIRPASELPAGGFAFYGVPFEGLTINEIGGRSGPDGLRQALSRLRPYSVDLDVDFSETLGISDLGDVEVSFMDYGPTLANAEQVTRDVIERGWVPVIGGGSHTITEGTLRGFSEAHGRNVGVVWFDNHPDLMSDYKGDRHYCGCPMRRLIEDGYVRPENIAFYALRGFQNAAAEIRWGREAGVHFHTMEEFHADGLDRSIEKALEIATNGTDAFYITFDTDSLDATHAPATQYPAPGGFRPFETMRFIRRLGMAGAGAMDVVEYAPLIDTIRNTGSLLATLMCEFMAGRAHYAAGNGA